MHIGLLAPEFLPNWGGVGTYCIELARALKELVELDVVTLERRIPGQPSMTEREMEAYFDGGLRVHVIARATDTFLYNASFQMAVLEYLANLQRDGGFDLVHSQHAHMSHVLYGMLSKRLPILTTVHTTIRGQRSGIDQSQTAFGDLEPSEKWQIALQPALRIAEVLSLRTSDRFVTMSQWMRRTLQKELPGSQVPIDVVPNGVDTDRYSPEPEIMFELPDGYEGPVVLITSRPTAAKGIGYAIGAMRAILSGYRDVRFVFAGGQPEPWRSSLLAAGVPPESFNFLGYVPYDSLPSLYARASVYLLPSLYENIPLRLLEAMSCGAPVVATNVSGVPEVVTHEENGLLIPPRDSPAIAGAVLRILNDPDLARRLGRAARSLMVDRFDWRVVAEGVVQSYRRVLGG